MSAPQGQRRRAGLVLAGAAVALEAAILWRNGFGLGGAVVVRCRQGHLFTTIWIPGVSLKAVRLGPVRFQRCPVGRHWSLVRLAARSALSEEEGRFADEHRDTRIP